MDPTSALRELLSAFSDRDTTKARAQLQHLTDWLAKGGFLPTVDRQDGSQTVFVVPFETPKAKSP